MYIAAAAGAILLIATFLPWYGWRGFEGSFTAWQSFSLVDVMLAFADVVAFGSVALVTTGRTVAIRISPVAIIATAGVLAALLILYRLVDPPAFQGEPGVEAAFPGGAPAELRYGALVGLLAAVGIAVGGLVAAREERWRPGWRTEGPRRRAGVSDPSRWR